MGAYLEMLLEYVYGEISSYPVVGFEQVLVLSLVSLSTVIFATYYIF